MIRYALICGNAHSFESWFSSSTDFDAQAARGLVQCPHCGIAKVSKQLMAPALGRSDKRGEPVSDPIEASSEPEAAPVALVDAKHQELRAMIRALHEHIAAHADNVGTGFAEEARKIHYGEAEKRTILGQTTPEEARELHEEGIAFMPLPALPDERN